MFSWIERLNSVGVVFPVVEPVWKSWWSMETRGRAICALIWSSGLICAEEENPLFWDYDKQDENDRPYLRESDAFLVWVPWLEPNLEFLQQTLSADYLHFKLLEAAKTLATGQEHQMALELAALAKGRSEVIEQRKK